MDNRKFVGQVPMPPLQQHGHTLSLGSTVSEPSTPPEARPRAIKGMFDDRFGQPFMYSSPLPTPGFGLDADFGRMHLYDNVNAATNVNSAATANLSGPANAQPTARLFDDKHYSIDQTPPLSPALHARVPSYLQADTTEDRFPILVRRESMPRLGATSATSATAPAAPAAPATSYGLPFMNLHRRAYSTTSATSNGSRDDMNVTGRFMADAQTHRRGTSQYDFRYQAAAPPPHEHYEHGRHPSVSSFSSVTSGHSVVGGLTGSTASVAVSGPSPVGVATTGGAYAPTLGVVSKGLGGGGGGGGGSGGSGGSGGAVSAGSSGPASATSITSPATTTPSPPSPNRFADASLDSLKDNIYSLCKDQHGCRFLQKKLEENNVAYVDMIFEQTCPHMVELMTDAFGNYLCQKLLERASEEQRTEMIRTASSDMVRIALNQHGTRALQRMVEYVTCTVQVDMIVKALAGSVVRLIKDLNGNHVIQKCLQRFNGSLGSQFIYEVVARNCVTVGTHRHGCCVLQRCIDHATPDQKTLLVSEVMRNAFSLVQDPFGNYVIQYVLGLDNPRFSEPLIAKFVGHVTTLSTQKFSSNVIEKCLRLAPSETRRLLVDELVHSPQLDRLLRDQYANYVIQTALDHADAESRVQLMDSIRPILPQIRATPYGRRIQSKIVQYS